MMREIKFRAWNSIDKCMCDNSTSLTNLRGFIKSKHYQPMQYTGLKDCNGVEIYEGDILVITTDRDGSYMNKVEEYQGIFGFFNMTCKQIKNPSDWDRPHNKTDSGWFLNGFSNLAGFDYSKLGEVDAGGNQACVKVIGNIHENPELLESAKC